MSKAYKTCAPLDDDTIRTILANIEAEDDPEGVVEMHKGCVHAMFAEILFLRSTTRTVN